MAFSVVNTNVATVFSFLILGFVRSVETYLFFDRSIYFGKNS